MAQNIDSNRFKDNSEDKIPKKEKKKKTVTMIKKTIIVSVRELLIFSGKIEKVFDFVVDYNPVRTKKKKKLSSWHFWRTASFHT